jgi:Zn-dependent M28 family amino/carboxypeptidase
MFLVSCDINVVDTELGATDDGMGVATLLQLIQYFVKYPPRRRAVFNINNGEEDGLNGAHVYAS